jgi:hypothetical protein
MDGLGKVGADTLLAILFCFLLGLLKDELRYMAVEVFICDFARDRCTHLGTHKARYHRRQRGVSHRCVQLKGRLGLDTRPRFATAVPGRPGDNPGRHSRAT